jgi:hypothetical protein
MLPPLLMLITDSNQLLPYITDCLGELPLLTIIIQDDIHIGDLMDLVERQGLIVRQGFGERQGSGFEFGERHGDLV